MLNNARIEYIRLHLCEFRTSGFNYSRWRNSVNYCLVYEVHARGLIGWGESTVKYGALAVARRLARRLLNKKCSDLDRNLYSGIPFQTNLGEWYLGWDRRIRQVREGFSIALYDLAGKLGQQSFYQMIGRHPKASTISLMPVIHVHEPSVMKEIATAWYSDGYRIFKVKLRGKLREDVAAVDAIAGIARDATVYVVDANFGYRDWDEALSCAREMKRLRACYFQNPIRVGMRHYCRLAEKGGIELTSDSFSWWPNIRRVLRFKAASLINLHPNLMGGVDNVYRVVEHGLRFGIQSIIGSSGWAGIQDKAYQKMAFSLANLQPCEDFGLNEYFLSGRREFYTCERGLPEVVSNKLSIDGGRLQDRDEFGFGIEVDRGLLEDRSVRSWEYP